MIYEAGAELPVWAPLAVPLAIRAAWQMIRVLGWWFLGWPLVGRLRRRPMDPAVAQQWLALARAGDTTVSRRTLARARAATGETPPDLDTAREVCAELRRERDDARAELAGLKEDLATASRIVLDGKSGTRQQGVRWATEAELIAAVDHPVQTLAQFTQYDADAHSRRYP